MQINRQLFTHAARALSESMDPSSMVVIAREFFHSYSIYERTGFQSSLAIPNKNAAEQIITDICDNNFFLDFVSLLIQYQEEGHRGREYQIAHLTTLVKAIYDQGYLYDKENRMFVENPRFRRTRNWGVFQEGQDLVLAFLHIDIVGNTRLVQKYPKEMIFETYQDLRMMVQESVDRRNGRFWYWEGDGGLCAFYFGNKNLQATLCGLEILHELELYNRLDRILPETLQVRFVVHSGLFEYTERTEELMQSEAMKRIHIMKSLYTKPNTLTISPVIHAMLDSLVGGQFSPLMEKNQIAYHSYALRSEK